MKNIMNRLIAMLYKEFIYLIRDKKMHIIIIAVPIIQAVLLGYAVNMDLKEVKTAVVNMDNSIESNEFIDSFFSSNIFTPVSAANMHQAEEIVLGGKALMIIVIPKGFSAQLKNDKTAPVQVILDATNSVNAGMASGYIVNLITKYNTEYIESKTGYKNSMGVDVEYRTWFNNNFESKNFFVPSMLAMLLIIVTVMLSGMAIVQEKESGTLEQITVSPITAWEFIIGKSIPFAIVSFIDVLLIIAISVFWFGIKVTGSFSLLLFASVLYIMCTLGIGLLISAISATQQQATMSMFMIIFPVILLSGFAFPIVNMPEVIQWVTYINPMRYYLDIIVGVFLKGLYFDRLQDPVFALFILSVLYIGLAALYLRKKLN